MAPKPRDPKHADLARRLDNMAKITVFVEIRSRGPHANEQEGDAPLAPAWFGEKWSGSYPGGLFQWKWAELGGSNFQWGSENGTSGWATIIRSSNADYPPGVYRIHHCAHAPCKCRVTFHAMDFHGYPIAWCRTQLHLFGVDSGIATLNVPQLRNAAKAADASAAVAGPSPPSPPSPPAPTRKTPEEYVRSGGRLTAKEIAVMKIGSPILQLSKSKKDKTDKKSNKDNRSKKAKKPKKVKYDGIKKTDEKPKKDNKPKKGNCHGIHCVPGHVLAAENGLWGQAFYVDVEDSTTIDDVKHKIFLWTGVRITSQRLIFAGRVLADDKTLAFYNIPDEAMLTYDDHILHGTAVAASLQQ